MAMVNSGSRIGILGGGFDPVHLAHLVIAETARVQFVLDTVVFVPSGIPPHRSAFVASGKHRLEMVKLAISGNPAFEASDIEIMRTGISYTYDTVNMIRSQNPGSAIFLILGKDAYAIVDSWHRVEELAKMVTFLVADRRGKDVPGGHTSFQHTMCRLDSPLLEISSSDIRTRCMKGQSIRYLVPEPVREYIEREHLYG
jgi:nicotinate-nucleotide adenylyltransferase